MSVFDCRSRLQTKDNSVGRKASKVTNMVSNEYNIIYSAYMSYSTKHHSHLE